MYDMVQLMGVRRFAVEELPALIGALMTAEFFYKFHSFLLEAFAFLATWYVYSAGVRLVEQLWHRGEEGSRRRRGGVG